MVLGLCLCSHVPVLVDLQENSIELPQIVLSLLVHLHCLSSLVERQNLNTTPTRRGNGKASPAGGLTGPQVGRVSGLRRILDATVETMSRPLEGRVL